MFVIEIGLLLLTFYNNVLCEIDHGAGVLTSTELDNIYNQLLSLHDKNWGTYDENDEYMKSDLDDTEWKTEDDANYYNLAKDIYAETSDDEDMQHMLDIDNSDYMAEDEDDERRYKYSTHSVFVVKMATYKEAIRYCQSVYGSSVATVGSAGKNRKMARVNKQAWIGLNGKNEWQSGSKAPFRNFVHGKSGTGRCTTIGTDGKWRKSACNKKHFFWCDNRNVPKPGTGEKNRDGKLAVSKHVRYLSPRSVVRCNLKERGRDGLDRTKSSVTMKFDSKKEAKLLTQRGYYLTILRNNARKLARRGCYLATMKITKRLAMKTRKGKIYVKVRVREAAPSEYMPSANFDIKKQRVQNNGIEERLTRGRRRRGRRGGRRRDDEEEGQEGEEQAEQEQEYSDNEDDEMLDNEETLQENGLTEFEDSVIDGEFDDDSELIAEEVNIDADDAALQQEMSDDDLDDDDDEYLSGDDFMVFNDDDDEENEVANDDTTDDDMNDDMQQEKYESEYSSSTTNDEDSNAAEAEQYVYDYEQDIYNNDDELTKFTDDRASLFTDDFEDFYTLDENDEEYYENYGDSIYSDELTSADDEEWGRWRAPRIRLPRIDPRIAIDAAKRAARDAADRAARIARDAAAAAARAARDAARKAAELAKKVKSGVVTAANAVGKFATRILDRLAFEGYASKTITLRYNRKYTKTWTRRTKQTINFGGIGTLTVDTYGRLTLTAGVDFSTSITLTIGGRWSVVTFQIQKIKAVLDLRHHLIFTFIMDMEARVNARMNFIEIGPRSPITTMIGVVPIVWRPFLKPYIGFTLNTKLTFTFNVGYNNVHFKAGFEINGGRFTPIKYAAKPRFVRNWSLKNGNGGCGIRVNMNPYIGAEFLITMYGTFTLGLDIRVNGNAVVSLPVDRGGGVCKTRPMQAALEMSPNIQLALIARITKIFGIKLPGSMAVNKRIVIVTIPIGKFNVYVTLPSFVDKAFALICRCRNNTPSPAPLHCPRGSITIGRQGGLNDIGGCGLEHCHHRYNQPTIEACAAHCTRNPRCKSYSYTGVGGDKHVPGKRVCTIYPSDRPNQRWGPNQIMCKPARQQPSVINVHRRACEGHWFHYTCPHGYRLRIVYSWYGRPANEMRRTCAHHPAANRVCNPRANPHNLRRFCRGNTRSCRFYINNHNMGGDHCPGIYKFEAIHLQCYR